MFILGPRPLVALEILEVSDQVRGMSSRPHSLTLSLEKTRGHSAMRAEPYRENLCNWCLES